mmetsp:Transcript_20136/g.51385  ORF Transcript_20136/g.51385 Transcript_20136/m.51385 type:complete len:295 (+) Transcript_20136:2779-3663(+)
MQHSPVVEHQHLARREFVPHRHSTIIDYLGHRSVCLIVPLHVTGFQPQWPLKHGRPRNAKQIIRIRIQRDVRPVKFHVVAIRHVVEGGGQITKRAEVLRLFLLKTLGHRKAVNKVVFSTVHAIVKLQAVKELNARGTFIVTKILMGLKPVRSISDIVGICFAVHVPVLPINGGLKIVLSTQTVSHFSHCSFLRGHIRQNTHAVLCHSVHELEEAFTGGNNVLVFEKRKGTERLFLPSLHCYFSCRLLEAIGGERKLLEESIGERASFAIFPRHFKGLALKACTLCFQVERDRQT